MYKCDNCDNIYRTLHDIPRIWPDIPKLKERLDIGGTVPAGECGCGALCYKVIEGPEAFDRMCKLLAGLKPKRVSAEQLRVQEAVREQLNEDAETLSKWGESAKAVTDQIIGWAEEVALRRTMGTRCACEGWRILTRSAPPDMIKTYLLTEREAPAGAPFVLTFCPYCGTPLNPVEEEDEGEPVVETDGATYVRCVSCGEHVVEGEWEAHLSSRHPEVTA